MKVEIVFAAVLIAIAGGCAVTDEAAGAPSELVTDAGPPDAMPVDATTDAMSSDAAPAVRYRKYNIMSAACGAAGESRAYCECSEILTCYTDSECTPLGMTYFPTCASKLYPSAAACTADCGAFCVNARDVLHLCHGITACGKDTAGLCP